MRREEADCGAEIFLALEERRALGALQPCGAEAGDHPGSLGLLQDGEGQSVGAVSRVEIIFPV